jgi:hypothetical protein
MKHSRIRQGIYLAAAVAFAAVSFDHFGSTTHVQAQDVRTPLPLEPGKLAPADDLPNAISQTAAIVEGVVSDIRYEYSEEQGPWTHVILSNVRAIAGDAPSTVEIRHFGGPLPSGALMVAAELPVFFVGKEYLVFLRNTEWNVSPVVGDLALRVEKVDDAEVLVNSDGQPVTRLDTGGLEFGPSLFQALDRDGTAPKVIDGGLRSIAIATKPLDRERFTASLRSTLDAQALRVSGSFFEKPAGLFNWRGQRAGQSPDAKPPDVPDSKDPEADFSEQKIR